MLFTSQIANEGVIGAVQDIAFDRFRSVCVDHADAIVIAWRKPFDEAVTRLSTCFEQIGPVPLEDTGSILRRGGDIDAVWAEAQRASEVIEMIRAGWVALAQFTRIVQANPDYKALQLAEVSYSDWTKHELRRRNLQPWEFMLAGLPLSLPTMAEYRQRAQAIIAAMAEVETTVDRMRSSIAGREIRVPVR